eukprot:5829851-Pyramimonas_sp.AAC.1
MASESRSWLPRRLKMARADTRLQDHTKATGLSLQCHGQGPHWPTGPHWPIQKRCHGRARSWRMRRRRGRGLEPVGPGALLEPSWSPLGALLGPW